MGIGSLLLIVIVIFIATRKRIWHIYTIIFSLLPFHEFLKQSVVNFSGSAGGFPLWREVAAIILFYKIMKAPSKGSKTLVLYGILVYVFFVILFWVGLEVDKESPVSVLRLYTINWLFLFCALKNKIKYNDYLCFFSIFRFVILLVCLTGIVERFFLYYPIHLYMDHLIINTNGVMTFKTPSYTIMGDLPRMCGVMSGPNQFGICLGLWIPIMIITYLKEKKFHTKTTQSIVIISTICLLLSFSRAGWIIFIFSILYYITKCQKQMIKYVMYGFFCIVAILTIVFLVMPEASDIILASATGKEASVSTRQDFIEEGLTEIIREPAGHGLGSGRIEGKTFSESSFLIIIYEIGILGFIMLFIYYILLLRNKHIGRNYPYQSISFAICLCSIVVGFVSVNIDEAPYMFYFWTLMGLLNNKHFKKLKPQLTII